MKYRIVKETHIDFDVYILEKKNFLGFWAYIECSWELERIERKLDALNAGAPIRKREVIK